MDKSHVAAAKRYAREVVGGTIPGGKYHKLACVRFLKDLTRDDLEFRQDKAQRACNFIETLHHVKGRWAAKKERIKLHPSQSFIVCNLFGFYDLDGTRRFTEAYVEEPRKNAKSTTASGIGLYMLCEDDEHAAEVYSGATTEKQAWEVFGTAHRMAKVNSALRDRYSIQVNAKSLIVEDTFSKFIPLIGKPGDGANVSCAIVDEYHEHEDDSLVDTMRQGIGSRTNPLIFKITTAGDNLGGPCYEHRQFCQTVLEGGAEADHLFCIIFHIDVDDEWDTVAALEKANPLLDIAKNRKLTLAELSEARRSASKQNAYRTKHLNEWVGAKVAWMNMLAWQRQKRAMDPEQYRARPAYLAIDLASKKDVAAVAAVIPDDAGYVGFQWFFAPEGAENDKYREFATDGSLTLTDGNATDFSLIEGKVRELAGLFDVQTVAFDSWQAQDMAQRLARDGLRMVEFPHQVRTMSGPMKSLEALVLSGQFWHDGNKCMTWMMGNVAAKMDAKENIYPNKARPSDPRCKIDGPVATIMAMGVALAADQGPSIDDWLNNPVAM